jgi:two-component system, OmpR family, copper resistance phosphate regulon response regulator CusR
MTEQKILLVEDEQKIADTLKLGLSENGYKVEVAYDGDAGTKLFQSKSFDLAVLDNNLPGMHAHHLCKNIRTINPEVPIIMLTALSSLDNKIEGYNAEADDYIIKPFEFKELLVRIKMLLKGTHFENMPIGPILKAGDLEMDLGSREVKRGGQFINLTSKEFQLLEYLMRNKNRVVSWAEISLNIWDADFDSNAIVIDVYINYLRNKLDKVFSKKLIQTCAEKGYVLSEHEFHGD